MDDFLPYYKFARQQALLICGDKDLAKDIVQDVFLRLYKMKKELSGEKNFKGYLRLAIKNHYITYYRKNSKCKFFEINNYTEAFHESIYTDLISDDLKKAIQSMDNDLKLPLMLHFIYEYKDPEIARILDIPVGTVKNRTFRAKAFLRKKLKNKNI